MTSLRYEHATCENLLKCEQILEKEPEWHKDAPKPGLNKWLQLGPMPINEIISKSNIDLKELNSKEIEVKFHKEVSGYEFGMFKKGTNIKHGVCRYFHNDGILVECFFRNNQ